MIGCKENEALITQDYLKSILEYNSETGVFIWLNGNGRTVYAGDIAGNYSTGYGRIKINKIAHSSHRLAWLYITGNWPEFEIDHINNIRNDNRFINLRDTNKNNFNKTIMKNNTSGYTGVVWNRRDCLWRASIGVNGKRIMLGNFITKEDAALAYKEAKEKYHTIEVNR